MARWHWWFAWRPVLKVDPWHLYSIVWLRRIRRRWDGSRRGWLYSTPGLEEATDRWA